MNNSASCLLELNTKLVRGADTGEIQRLMVRALEAGYVEDACVLMFYTRDIRGGRGERDLFKTLFCALVHHDNSLGLALQHLIPEYGSWKDVIELMGESDLPAFTIKNLTTMFIDQLRADAATEEGHPISLAAKWAPREGKAFDHLAHRLATAMFPEMKRHQMQLAAYRRLIAGLNRRLNTVETLMADGKWSSIVPWAVPEKADNLYRRAFLNLNNDNTLRLPNDPDRMTCRAHFMGHYARPSVVVDDSSRYDTVRHAVYLKTLFAD
jgi:hypothetical protein